MKRERSRVLLYFAVSIIAISSAKIDFGAEAQEFSGVVDCNSYIEYVDIYADGDVAMVNVLDGCEIGQVYIGSNATAVINTKGNGIIHNITNYGITTITDASGGAKITKFVPEDYDSSFEGETFKEEALSRAANSMPYRISYQPAIINHSLMDIRGGIYVANETKTGTTIDLPSIYNDSGATMTIRGGEYEAKNPEYTIEEITPLASSDDNSVWITGLRSVPLSSQTYDPYPQFTTPIIYNAMYGFIRTQYADNNLTKSPSFKTENDTIIAGHSSTIKIDGGYFDNSNAINRCAMFVDMDNYAYEGGVITSGDSLTIIGSWISAAKVSAGYFSNNCLALIRDDAIRTTENNDPEYTIDSAALIGYIPKANYNLTEFGNAIMSDYSYMNPIPATNNGHDNPIWSTITDWYVVTPYVVSIDINESELEVNVGDRIEVEPKAYTTRLVSGDPESMEYATITYEDGGDFVVDYFVDEEIEELEDGIGGGYYYRYASADTNVVSVDENGIVRAVGIGETTIRVYFGLDSTRFKDVKVTVDKEATDKDTDDDEEDTYINEDDSIVVPDTGYVNGSNVSNDGVNGGGDAIEFVIKAVVFLILGYTVLYIKDRKKIYSFGK